jgi:dihydrodipicolinate synthase/N-acetylneuraminate lyase
LGYKQHVMTDLPFDVDRLSAIPVAPACFDRFTWTGLSLGCRAQVTAGASVVPGRIASIFRQWDAGERDAAKATFDALMPFFELPMKLYKGHRDHYSSLYYYAVGRMGFDVGQPRLPSLWPVPSELASAIDRELDRLELLV